VTAKLERQPSPRAKFGHARVNPPKQIVLLSEECYPESIFDLPEIRVPITVDIVDRTKFDSAPNSPYQTSLEGGPAYLDLGQLKIGLKNGSDHKINPEQDGLNGSVIFDATCKNHEGISMDTHFITQSRRTPFTGKFIPARTKGK
jgi:hypothetical protein